LFFRLLGELTVAIRFLDDVWGGFELIDMRAFTRRYSLSF
jgi:hypothetical protein